MQPKPNRQPPITTKSSAGGPNGPPIFASIDSLNQPILNLHMCQKRRNAPTIIAFSMLHLLLTLDFKAVVPNPI